MKTAYIREEGVARMTRYELKSLGPRAWEKGVELTCPYLRFVDTYDEPLPPTRHNPWPRPREGTWLAQDRDPCPGCKVNWLRSCHNRGKPQAEKRFLIVPSRGAEVSK